MLVLKSEIAKRGCSVERTCENPGRHCALGEPLESETRNRLERMVRNTSTEFFMPLNEIVRIYKFPAGSSMAVRLKLRLAGDFGEEDSELAVLVTNLNGKNGDSTAGDLEAIYHVRRIESNPKDEVEQVERIPLLDINIETVIRTILEHPFMFRL